MAVIGSQLTYCVEVAAELLADVEEQTVRSVHQAQRPGRESPVAPGSQTKCDPDWLLVSSRLTGRSYVRGRKPARNDQRSVYRSLGFITVKFAPQREIPRSGKATTACSNAPRVDFFCGHHIDSAGRTRHGET